MIPVDHEIDVDGTSHQRAADAVTHDRALIEQTEHDEYRVLLPEYSEGRHRVQYRISRFHGRARVASCDCSHHEHRGQHTGQPCAHIIAVALSDDRDRRTARGQPIRPYCPPTAKVDTDEHEPTNEPEIDADDVDPVAEAMADGGRDQPDNYAAGQGGETFGRPEADL